MAQDVGLSILYTVLLGICYHAVAFLGLKYLFTGNPDPCGCGTSPPPVLSPATDVPEVGPQGEVTVHLGAVTTPSPPTEDRSCARAC